MMGARERVTRLASVHVESATRAVAGVGTLGRGRRPTLPSDVCRNCGTDGARERPLVGCEDHDANAIAL
jgi:hypothetical protein